MYESERTFHEVLAEWRRSSRNLDGLHDVIYKAHLDEHDGPFRLCSHPTCRAVTDLYAA